MVELDLTYYDGEDRYSDGDIEEKILQYIHENEPERYDAVLEADPALPVFYHLSDARTSLLSWYDFDPQGRVLEIGGGMGALTGLLCERCREVVSVELSRRRAAAIAERCRERDNLKIMVGDFAAMDFGAPFDYITVIGVLEHQSAISDAADAQEQFLCRLRELLAPGGKILLAIENQYGLKYWCGEVDDHSGIPFGTINQFRYGGKARTFDRRRLGELLGRAGLPRQKFFYPLPDYKFPRVIYSDACLPQTDVHTCMIPTHYSNYYGYQPLIADESRLYAPLLRNGVFPFFANSFLVEAGGDGVALSPVDFAAVTVERVKKYRSCTRRVGDRFEKLAPHPSGEAHLRAAHENLMELRARGLPTIEERWENGRLLMPAMRDATLEDLFFRQISSGAADKALELLDAFYQAILRSSDHVPAGENALFSLLDCGELRQADFGPILKKAYCDMVLSNCFAGEDGWHFYDQEWAFPRLPAGFVLFLALSVLYRSRAWLDDALPLKSLWERFHISPEQLAAYETLEHLLYQDVQSDGICAHIGFLRERSDAKVEDNIHLLMEGRRTIDAQQALLAQQTQILAEKDAQLAGRDKIIAEQGAQLAGRDAVIAEQSAQLAGRDTIIAEKDGQIAGRETIIAEKDSQIAGRETVIAEKDSQIRARESIIAEKEAALAAVRQTLEERERALQELRRTLDSYHGGDLRERLRIALRCLQG